MSARRVTSLHLMRLNPGELQTVALCSDGSLWRFDHRGAIAWVAVTLPPGCSVPQPSRASTAASAQRPASDTQLSLEAAARCPSVCSPSTPNAVSASPAPGKRPISKG
jgi:hypothetical protein